MLLQFREIKARIRGGVIMPLEVIISYIMYWIFNGVLIIYLIYKARRLEKFEERD